MYNNNMRSSQATGKLICIMLLSIFFVCLSSCTDIDKSTTVEDNQNGTTEITEKGKNSVEPDSVSEPPYSVDENGEPTPDYMEYLYEEQMKEEAMNAIAEDAQREMMEDAYEPEHHGFPY